MCLVEFSKYDMRVWVVFWVCELLNYDLSVENLFGYDFWIECWIEFCKFDLICEVNNLYGYEFWKKFSKLNSNYYNS